MAASVEAREAISFAPADSPNSNKQVVAEAANEFVFAVVGHIGAGTSTVAKSFKDLLERRTNKIQTTILKARSVIEDWAQSTGTAFPAEGPSPYQVDFIAEPLLEFGFNQQTTNPKTGLYLYGPLDDKGKPKHIKTGVVGTKNGIQLFRNWLRVVNSFIEPASDASANHAPYPGFNSVFSTTIGAEPELEVELSQTKLASAIRQGRRHEAVKEAVSIFEDAIRVRLDEDIAVDVWFAVIPDEIYKYGRPQAIVPKEEAIKSRLVISQRRATEILSGAPSLFREENIDAQVFLFEPNFHHQLKARLLDTRIVVLQILRESTLSSLLGDTSNPRYRRLQDPASIAWNLSTTLFFKGGGHPWKVASVRPRVCYIGLVFKLFPDGGEQGRKACCGAQMFLDSGDGLVFRGTPGNWYNADTKQFHLSEDEARSLIERIVTAYKERDPDGLPPAELFIHGRTRFDENEWKGFSSGAPDTKVTTVRISDSNDIKLYAPRKTPVLRGTTLAIDDRLGYLWTRGFINELGTYPGREVPKPLAVELVHGDTDLATVMRDLLMLTKLNFNACIFADGSPVTLRFADAVGEIITAIPETRSIGPFVPLPFKHYI